MNEKYWRKLNEKLGLIFKIINNKTVEENMTDPVRKKYLI
jgi:hypothetical protein